MPIGLGTIAFNPRRSNEIRGFERANTREGREILTRYRIYRNTAGETIYISAHDGRRLHNPREFPSLDDALALLRQGGIPEYEIRRVTKELAAINGAIVQVAETLPFS